MLKDFAGKIWAQLLINLNINYTIRMEWLIINRIVLLQNRVSYGLSTSPQKGTDGKSTLLRDIDKIIHKIWSFLYKAG